MTQAAALAPTAEQLLITAERLLAEKGLGAVSMREIAREAGQRNHSALSYHFGSQDGLIEAILDYRMAPLNQQRQQQLDVLKAEGRADDIRSLVEVMIRPFAEELLKPADQSYYLSLLSQLMSHREWQSLFTAHERRASAVLEVGTLLVELMQQEHSEQIAVERMRLMGLHLLNTVGEWDAMRRRGELELDAESLEWRIENLMDYQVGALMAFS